MGHSTKPKMRVTPASHGDRLRPRMIAAFGNVSRQQAGDEEHRGRANHHNDEDDPGENVDHRWSSCRAKSASGLWCLLPFGIAFNNDRSCVTTLNLIQVKMPNFRQSLSS